jgi:hypothetical protein
MKRLNSPIVVVAVFLSSVSLAQNEAKNKVPAFGLGFSIQQEVLDTDARQYYPSFDLSNALVPVTFASKFRTEFELGLWRHTSSGKYNKTGLSNARLSVGFYFLHPRQNEKMIFYFGPRVGLDRSVQWAESEDSTPPKRSHSRNDWHFDAAFGGEYLLSPHFSFGGEARFLYYRFGKYDDFDEYKNSLFTTRAMVIFRFYF